MIKMKNHFQQNKVIDEPETSPEINDVLDQQFFSPDLTHSGQRSFEQALCGQIVLLFQVQVHCASIFNNEISDDPHNHTLTGFNRKRAAPAEIPLVTVVGISVAKSLFNSSDHESY